MRVLIDTCVIIDGLEKREPFWRSARDIFYQAASQRAGFFLTAKSVTDIFYLEYRRIHDSSQTRDVISRLLKLFWVVDTTAADISSALLKEAPDYEDAVMMETAFREKMDCIITRNIRHFQNARIPVMTPEEFLSITEENH